MSNHQIHVNKYDKAVQHTGRLQKIPQDAG